MVIIGCDFHPNGQQVLAIDDQSREVVSARWLNQARDGGTSFMSHCWPEQWWA